MGPGFDTLGMSLSLYLYCKVTRTSENTITSNISIDLNFQTNLISSTLILIANKMQKHLPKIHLDIHSDIPLSSGLGSSASAIVAGILIANGLLNLNLSESQIINFAVSLEGHPDNVVPCILGGIVTSCVNTDGKVFWSKINPFPDYIKFLAIVPDYNLPTSISRGLLPTVYNKSDVVFNLQRLSLLIANNNNTVDKKTFIENLKIATQDSIHQPYRMDHIQGFKEIKNNKDIITAFISGAGPTIMVLYDDDDDLTVSSLTNVNYKIYHLQEGLPATSWTS